MSGTGGGHRDPEGPWVSEVSECAHCGHEWTSVHPCSEWVECPRCEKVSRSTHAIERDEWIERELRGGAK